MGNKSVDYLNIVFKFEPMFSKRAYYYLDLDDLDGAGGAAQKLAGEEMGV